MRKLTTIVLFMSVALLLTECREPFLPDFETGKNDYLVVEGFIHVGQKAVTSITLSRVAPLMGTTQVFEDKAILFIERKDGTLFPLQAAGNGNFKSDSLNLDPTMEYRLLITAENDNQYASEFTKPKITPAIDSLHWQWKDEGIQIYVSAHDSESNTKYYKWDYKETWEYHSAHKSKYEYKNGGLEVRGDPFMFKLYKCWQSEFPEDLRFASTQELDADAIKFPLILFGHYSDRTSVRYSIFVEQRAISKDEFDYLQLIQKNSTVTGSLFDPMPSEIRGNIQSLGNPGEMVIGFIGASTSTTMRYFVTAAEFGVDPPAKCEPVIITSANYDAFYATGSFIPIDLSTGALAYCMDCKLRGGTSTEPDFW